MTLHIKNLSLSLAAAFLLASCASDGGETKEEKSTPTAGNIHISVDETLRPLMETELHGFHKTYERAHVDVSYIPESQAYEEFMKDSSVVLVGTRELTAEELEYFKQFSFTPRTTRIAYDAVALIINKENMDSTIKRSQLGDVFTGKIKDWKELDESNPSGEIQVVFDHAGSSTLSYLKNYYNISGKLPENFFAVNNNEEVIKYVTEHPKAMGVIGVGFISDSYDSLLRSFSNSVRVVGFNAPDTIRNDGGYFQPYQAFINNRSYPFVRTVYIISREFHNGLGSGLAAYVAGSIGQPLVLSTGLVPASMPVRNIEVKKEFNQ